jgi:hypothetical protein
MAQGTELKYEKKFLFNKNNNNLYVVGSKRI